MKILFSEKQRFTQWWIWALLISVNLLMIYGIIQQIILGKPFGDHPAPNIVLIFVSLIPFGLTYLIYSFRLETIITEESISFKLAPFTSLQMIRWYQIDKAYIRTYKPILEYGGWGYRVSFKHGKAYNIGGNQGLQLELRNGKKILIGTQKATDLQQVLNNLNSTT